MFLSRYSDTVLVVSQRYKVITLDGSKVYTIFLTYCGLLAATNTRNMLGFVADVFSDEEVVEAGVLAGILRNNVAGNKLCRGLRIFYFFSKKLTKASKQFFRFARA